MRTILIGAALLLCTASPALAQGIAVHDNAALLKAIEQIKNAKAMVDQGKQQIAEAQKLYQNLNGLTDISKVASKLGDDALRQLDLNGGNLDGITRGDYDFTGAAKARVDAAYNEMIGSLGGNATDVDRQSAKAIAAQAGVAEATGRAASERKQYLTQLVDRLATATTAKEVQDLTARIEGERALMENDRLALDAIDRNNQADAAATAERVNNEGIQARRAARAAQ